MKSLEQLIGNWLSSIGSYIIEQKFIRDKIDQDIKESRKYQEDILALLKFIESTDLPNDVQRGLKRCLEWNPHANK